MAEVVDVLVEVPRGGLVKRRADGTVDYVSPVPSPFNYGCIPSRDGGDGDPLDAVLLGPRRARGDVVRTRIWAVVRFVDDGLVDEKVVCATEPPTPGQLLLVRAFFLTYSYMKRALNRARGRRGRTAYDGLRVLGIARS